MSPQADAHVDLYNKLPFIDEAYAVLRQELKADPSVSNDDLVLPILQDPDVLALFRDGVAGENDKGFFGIWIVHRHFALESGERMASTGITSNPTPADSTQFAERWDLNVNGIEFVQVSESEVSDTQRAPSASFAKAFQELISKKIGPGFIYFETADAKTWSHFVKAVPRDTTSTNLPADTTKY